MTNPQLVERFMALFDAELEKRLYPIGNAPPPGPGLEARKAHAELRGHVGSVRAAAKAAISAIELNGVEELRERLQTHVMQALWPIMGGNHTDADTWGEIGDSMEAAIGAALNGGQE